MHTEELHRLKARLNEIAAMAEPTGGPHARAAVLQQREEEVDELIQRWNDLQAEDERTGYSRIWPVDDVIVRSSGGDKRTVEAYCAVFDSPAEINDQHGRYREVIHRSAFTRAISRGINSVQVYFNHGMRIDGSPSDLGSVPIGHPLEIRPDGKGLLTITRYNRSELADATLEAIRNGDIKGYSFRGRILRSDPERVPRVRPGGELPTVLRKELGLTEYGPTPSPYYADASVVAVRSAENGSWISRAMTHGR